jgi:cytochrome c oxidase assembly factor CtaG
MKEFSQVGWTWYPSVVIGFSLWTLLYVFAVRRGRSMPLGQQIAFHIGTLVGLLALVSPLDELGDEYLFSAHMVQHLLLVFGAAPLWLIGAPGWLVDKVIPQRLTRLFQWLVSPMSAFWMFTGVLSLWHLPTVYGIAQASEAVHIFEHLTFIGAALIGWWPVLGAATSRFPKPAPPVRMLYLFLLAIPCTVLAAMLTFAHAPFYAFYVSTLHPFGMNALQDQHLGGLLMWLPTHLVLLVLLGMTFLQWFAASNRQSEQELVNTLS